MKKTELTRITFRLPIKTKDKIDQLVKKYSTLNKQDYTRTDIIIKAINEFIRNRLKD